MNDLFRKSPVHTEIIYMSSQDIVDYTSALKEFMESPEFKNTYQDRDERINKSLQMVDEIIKWQQYLQSKF